MFDGGLLQPLAGVRVEPIRLNGAHRCLLRTTRRHRLLFLTTPPGADRAGDGAGPAILPGERNRSASVPFSFKVIQVQGIDEIAEDAEAFF
jgi:hypothetical protein